MTTAGHTAHTPWHVADNPVGNSGAEVHANVKVKSKLVVCRIGGPDRSANAALIAMAPDLLAERDRLLADNKRLKEACEATRNALVALRTRLKTEPSVQGRGWVSLGIVLNDAVEKADAALGGDHA